MLSFPPAVELSDFWSDQIDGYRIGDLSHNDMYRKATRQKETIFNMMGKDLLTESKDVISIVHPIYQGRSLYSVVFWELDIYPTLASAIIPASFEVGHFQLMQVYFPQSVFSGKRAKNIFEKFQTTNLDNINQNAEYLEWVDFLNELVFSSDHKVDD